MMIGAQVTAAFAQFKRPITYIRDGEEIATWGFLNQAPISTTLAGDLDQINFIVTMSVEDMMVAAIYPPRKYDRILFGTHSLAVEEQPVIQYDGADPILIRLRCSG